MDVNSALCPLCTDGIGHQMDISHANKVAALKASHAELLSFCKAIVEDQPSWIELQEAIAAAEKLDKGA